MIMAMVFLVVAGGIVLAGTVSMKANRINAETWFRLHGQAMAFARAGLTEAIAWFRRQSSQPVISFAPKRDLVACPPILDTDEPALGLVREFQISGTLYGRYEVPLTKVKDISKYRGLMDGSGAVWLVHSQGYVFRREDDTKAFNEAPNTVLARTNLNTEIRRFVLTPPAQSALCGAEGKNIKSLGKLSKVAGGTFPAVAYLRGTGTPTLNANATGGTQQIPASATDPIPTVEEAFGVEAIFSGLSIDDLRSMADVIVNDITEFPNPVPPNSIIFADCDLVFNSIPLHCKKNGSILIINGRLTINNVKPDPCYFKGFIYATGNVSLNAVSTIYGQLISKNSITVTGNSDPAEIYYDEGVLNSMLADIGQYRISRATTDPNSKE